MSSQLGVIGRLFFQSIFLLAFLLACPTTQAAELQYQVEIIVTAENANGQVTAIKSLLEKHLPIIKWRENSRLTPAEWQRLVSVAPQDIKNLLKTEGYFSPNITSAIEKKGETSLATFTIALGKPVTISKVNIQFGGAILQQQNDISPNVKALNKEWLLPIGEQFRQEYWSLAKQKLLTSLLVERYPNARISNSKAEVDLESSSVALTVEVDSGPVVQFGELTIEGLERYSENVVRNNNPIKPGKVYNQTDLLTFQTRLQEIGYFKNVEVTADTQLANHENNNAPIKVVVEENKSIKVGVGAGYSTNTGARVQFTYDDLDFMDRDWRFASSLKVEQKAQFLGGQIQFPVTSKGYRDSMSADMNRTAFEGQTVTSSQLGIKRTWGPRKREQYLGANYLIEQQDVDGGETTTKKVGTLNYGITLRRTDNDLAPMRGYLFNAQFAAAPLDSLSNGRFLHSYIKTQAYYPITSSTQLIARAELGMVNGKNSAPETFLFRAGGDQSVRGYAFQSLGIKEANATVGGRYLATGSVEIVQWLTQQWGAAVFVDAGNVANLWQDLKPVYGYGLGVRWKSPLGPIGADIAYGQEMDDYRLHFNIGVAF